MKILVANLGTTSFKFRLFDMDGETLLARGGIERIGDAQSKWSFRAGERVLDGESAVPDHTTAVRLSLAQLSPAGLGVLADQSELGGIGFKAVHAQNLSGAALVTPEVLAAMEAYADVVPAHNPPYVKAMRQLAEAFPALPQVAAFETNFHQTIPPAQRYYAVPWDWVERFGVRRYGFHGASHQYVAERTCRLLGNPDARVISCHLGGSSSLCASRGGVSQACSMGMSPQTGLPQNNRVGDFDVFALPLVMRNTGKSLAQVLDDLANRSGLEGMAGRRDIRDIQAAADGGDARAGLALDVFVASIRHYLGAYLVLLGGADAVVFTGGIGENSRAVRKAVCQNLEWFGIELDEAENDALRGEATFHAAASRVQLWTMPTDEEIVVARYTQAVIAGAK